MADGGRLVYSTDSGRTCPDCGQAVADCTCDAVSKKAASQGPVRVALDTRKRRGKAVTTITGIALPGAQLTKFAKALKKRCGSGGTVKDGVIEIQGDHRELITGELEKQGYKVRS